MRTKVRTLRLDDEVYEFIQALQSEETTVNEGLRLKFGLGAPEQKQYGITKASQRRRYQATTGKAREMSGELEDL